MTMRELGDGDLAEKVPMERVPQRMVNVEVGDRDALEATAAVWDAVKEEEAPLEGRGRILLRPSGTEPLVRVMVEAPDAEEADAICERLAAVVRRGLYP
jgi:phosphoglucosamine mutase